MLLILPASPHLSPRFRVTRLISLPPHRPVYLFPPPASVFFLLMRVRRGWGPDRWTPRLHRNVGSTAGCLRDPRPETSADGLVARNWQISGYRALVLVKGGWPFWTEYWLNLMEQGYWTGIDRGLRYRDFSENLKENVKNRNWILIFVKRSLRGRNGREVKLDGRVLNRVDRNIEFFFIIHDF